MAGCFPPLIELILTILPDPFSFISLATEQLTIKQPSKFTFITSSKSLTCCSKRFPNLTIPAQLTRPSGVSAKVSNACLTDSSLVISTGRLMEFSISASTSFSFS